MGEQGDRHRWRGGGFEVEGGRGMIEVGVAMGWWVCVGSKEKENRGNGGGLGGEGKAAR